MVHIAQDSQDSKIPEGGGQLSAVLDAGLRWDKGAQVGSHRPCFMGGALGLGYMQSPCSGTHSVVVGRQKGKHEVLTGFAKCWAATSLDEVSMHGLCEEATAGLGGSLEIHFRGEPTRSMLDWTRGSRKGGASVTAGLGGRPDRRDRAGAG